MEDVFRIRSYLKSASDCREVSLIKSRARGNGFNWRIM